MSVRCARAGLSGLAIAICPLSGSLAHEIVGNRFFPATLGIDDPGVNDGLSFPTVDSLKTDDTHAADAGHSQRNSTIEFALGLAIFAIVGLLGTLHPAVHLVI